MMRLTPRSEDGSVAPWMAVLAVAMMLMLAMIVDSQLVRSGRRQAGDIAFEAARAGAQATDRAQLALGIVALDEPLARQTINGYLGPDMTAVVQFTADEVIVTVTFEVDRHFGFIGGNTEQVSSTRRAQIAQG